MFAELLVKSLYVVFVDENYIFHSLEWQAMWW